MDIVMVSARYPPFTGGTEIHVAEVSRVLAERGHRPTVITTTFDRRAVGYETVDGVHIVRVLAHPQDTDLHFAPGIWHGVLDRRPDIVHVQGYHTLVAPVAMVAAWRAQLPYVVTFHSGGHSSRVRASLRPVQHRLLRPLLQRAQQLIAVSDFESKLMQQKLHLPAARFVTVPNGVSTEFFDADQGVRDGMIMTSVGRIERYKGHHLMIEALPTILERLPQARLRVVGRGPYESELRRLCGELGVTDHVDFTSVAADDRATMARLLAESKVVALLSTFESQGMAAREALAAGARLLVADSTALSELRTFKDVRVVAADCATSQLAQVLVEQLLAPPVVDRSHVERCAESTDRLERIYESVLSAPRQGSSA